MNKYWYNLETKHLCTDEQMTQPFLCSTEATPLTFNNSTECGEFLKENDIEGSVCYKLPRCDHHS